ncbi:hypothetical protein [Halorhodospira halochloris]|nr:hypothetical protein [Halorhodospira halochloris]
MNPSLEASWRHPWRQDLHIEAARLSGEFIAAPYGTNSSRQPALLK